MSSKLLLDEKPLLIIPSLAIKVGLNESIVLQQIHYWLQISGHTHEGHKWIYNTYDDWVEQFSWWSKATIRRVITKLENEGILVTGNFNKIKIDKTKWYRIDYEKLEGMSSPCAQNEQSMYSDRAVEELNMSTPIPENTTESTTEKKEKEEDDEPTVENPILFHEENGFGVLSPYIAQKVNYWSDDLSAELVIEAMKIAIERNALTWSYVETILRDWLNKKLLTVDQVKAAQLAYRQKKSVYNPGSKQGRKELIPDWLNKPNEPPDEPTNLAVDNFEEERRKLEERIRKRKAQQE